MGNSLGRPAAPAACVADLDDGDLGLIFSLLSRRHHGPVITLVCRKWREVFWAEPRLWRSIRLARPISAAMPEEAAGAAQQLQVLQRVARHVQVAEVRAMHYGPQPPEAAAWHAAALLLELPEMLGALALRHEAAHHTAPPCLPEVALEVLPRFAAGLTRLELASTRLAARPAAAALARLPHLRHLALNMGAVSGDVLQAAQQLPALTRLELDSPPAELPERLPQLLGALTQLRELACMGCGALPAGTITAVAEQLRQLQALALAMPLPPHELRQLARLPQLRRLELCERRIRADSAELPPPAACAALQSHHFWRESDSGCFVVAGAQLRCCAYTGGTLQVEGMRPPLASLQVLAEALLPGGARAAPHALAGLVLRDAALNAEAVQVCPLLEGLRLLHLCGCWAAPAGEQADAPLQPSHPTEQHCGDLLPAVQLLLGQAPALEQLALLRCRLGPPGSGAGGDARLDVSSNPQLRRLALQSASRFSTARLLPATYPAGLEEIELQEAYPSASLPAPAALPPGLAACTALRRLRLNGLRLPQGLPARLLQGLAELEVCRGGLERLPPGMGAAQRLTRLTLDGNTQLALSHSDAEALRRLPHLRALQVQHSETPPRVAARLRQLAPRVEAVWSIENAFHRLAQRSDQQWRPLLLASNIGWGAGVTEAMRHLTVLGPTTTGFPAIGYKVETIHRGNVEVQSFILDESNRSASRLLLRWYLKGATGIVYVVDSSDVDGLECNREQLSHLCREEAGHGLPLLLLANKQDRPAALDPQDLAQRLGVPALCQQRPWHAQGSCAISGEGLLEGFDWLARSMAGVE